jgi:hypothetical protein
LNSGSRDIQAWASRVDALLWQYWLL